MDLTNASMKTGLSTVLIFTPQPLKSVFLLFSSIVSGWDGLADGGKNLCPRKLEIWEVHTWDIGWGCAECHDET